MTPAHADRLLLGPGPSNPYPEAIEAMGRPVLGHLDPDLLAVAAGITERLRALFHTRNRLTLPVSGTGSAGMEACLVSLLEPDDTAIVGINGYFGERLAEVARRVGAKVERVEAPWGTPLDPGALLETQRRIPRARLVAMVHAETSTGVRNDVSPLGALQDTDTLFLLDTVTSLGGIPVDVDGWGVDACYSATQKCLGAPPGLAPVTLSERAAARVAARRNPPGSFYLDLGLLDSYLNAPHWYHHTISASLLYALDAALRRVLDEGLPAVWARHLTVGELLQGVLPGIGYELIAPEDHRLPQLTAVRLPEGVDDAASRRLLREDYGIEVGGGLGPFAGKAWRIGLMGHAARERSVVTLLGALSVLGG